MIRYCAAAMALKAFSCTPATRRAYRALGNSVGARRRASGGMPDFYLARIERMIALAASHGIPADGSRMVEIGTGWLHWEGVTTRLFFDVSGVLYDVWDNRQMEGLKNYLAQLEGRLDRVSVEPERREKARRLIARILETTRYEEIYDLLGMEYVIEPEGRLDRLERGTFDLVVSGGVLEHIGAEASADFVAAMAALLRPGGLSLHGINIRDHLYQYDSSVSPKQYLKYSDRVWKICFENNVQYINRIQRSRWLELFGKAGMELIEERVEPIDMNGLVVAPAYRHYSLDDLRCGGLILTHRKSPSAAA